MIYFSFDFALLTRVKYPLVFGIIVSKERIVEKGPRSIFVCKKFRKVNKSVARHYLNWMPSLGISSSEPISTALVTLFFYLHFSVKLNNSPLKT